MHPSDAHEGVEVRQDIERVLRVVGVAVVLAGVHVGLVGGIRWSRTVERHIQEREVKAHVTLEDAAVGVIDITDQRESQPAWIWGLARW
ncbi:Uncharacterised protein [Mycobacterium tuberculosis]|nr:Uncharacterised protein [Mycobacterium tuberculosis]